MDQIYARIKRQRKHPYRRVASDAKLFDLAVPDPDSCSEYDPNTLLDDGEYYRVSEFKSRDFCPSVLKGKLHSADVSELSKNEFGRIAYLMSVQNGNFFFQRVRPSSLLRRKAIVFGDAAALEEPSDRIVINPQPDAMYIPSSDALLLRELAAVSPIFPGIDTLYKEATVEDVKAFLDLDFIESELEPSAVSKPNRKRIALAVNTLENMSNVERDEVFAYIGDYIEGKLDFDADSGVFIVTTDDQLKTLVFGIEQRFYTTVVGSEKRLANSIMKI